MEKAKIEAGDPRSSVVVTDSVTVFDPDNLKWMVMNIRKFNRLAQHGIGRGGQQHHNEYVGFDRHQIYTHTHTHFPSRHSTAPCQTAL
jgi:hypothetical protein